MTAQLGNVDCLVVLLLLKGNLEGLNFYGTVGLICAWTPEGN